MEIQDNIGKAREIGLAIGKGAVNVIIATAGALEMAEWKDQQFKEYLEKKLNKNYQDLNYYIDYKQPSELFQNRIDIIEEIINELFKED